MDSLQAQLDMLQAEQNNNSGSSGSSSSVGGSFDFSQPTSESPLQQVGNFLGLPNYNVGALGQVDNFLSPGYDAVKNIPGILASIPSSIATSTLRVGGDALGYPIEYFSGANSYKLPGNVTDQGQVDYLNKLGYGIQQGGDGNYYIPAKTASGGFNYVPIGSLGIDIAQYKAPQETGFNKFALDNLVSKTPYRADQGYLSDLLTIGTTFGGGALGKVGEGLLPALGSAGENQFVRGLLLQDATKSGLLPALGNIAGQAVSGGALGTAFPVASSIDTGTPIQGRDVASAFATGAILGGGFGAVNNILTSKAYNGLKSQLGDNAVIYDPSAKQAFSLGGSVRPNEFGEPTLSFKKYNVFDLSKDKGNVPLLQRYSNDTGNLWQFTGSTKEGSHTFQNAKTGEIKTVGGGLVDQAVTPTSTALISPVDDIAGQSLVIPREPTGGSPVNPLSLGTNAQGQIGQGQITAPTGSLPTGSISDNASQVQRNADFLTQREAGVSGRIEALQTSFGQEVTTKYPEISGLEPRAVNNIIRNQSDTGINRLAKQVEILKQYGLSPDSVQSINKFLAYGDDYISTSNRINNIQAERNPLAYGSYNPTEKTLSFSKDSTPIQIAHEFGHVFFNKSILGTYTDIIKSNPGVIANVLADGIEDPQQKLDYLNTYLTAITQIGATKELAQLRKPTSSLTLSDLSKTELGRNIESLKSKYEGDLTNPEFWREALPLLEGDALTALTDEVVAHQGQQLADRGDLEGLRKLYQIDENSVPVEGRDVMFAKKIKESPLDLAQQELSSQFRLQTQQIFDTINSVDTTTQTIEEAASIYFEKVESQIADLGNAMFTSGFPNVKKYQKNMLESILKNSQAFIQRGNSIPQLNKALIEVTDFFIANNQAYKGKSAEDKKNRYSISKIKEKIKSIFEKNQLKAIFSAIDNLVGIAPADAIQPLASPMIDKSMIAEFAKKIGIPMSRAKEHFLLNGYSNLAFGTAKMTLMTQNIVHEGAEWLRGGIANLSNDVVWMEALFQETLDKISKTSKTEQNWITDTLGYQTISSERITKTQSQLEKYDEETQKYLIEFADREDLRGMNPKEAIEKYLSEVKYKSPEEFDTIKRGAIIKAGYEAWRYYTGKMALKDMNEAIKAGLTPMKPLKFYLTMTQSTRLSRDLKLFKTEAKLSPRELDDLGGNIDKELTNNFSEIQETPRNVVSRFEKKRSAPFSLESDLEYVLRSYNGGMRKAVLFKDFFKKLTMLTIGLNDIPAEHFGSEQNKNAVVSELNEMRRDITMVHKPSMLETMTSWMAKNVIMDAAGTVGISQLYSMGTIARITGLRPVIESLVKRLTFITRGIPNSVRSRLDKEKGMFRVAMNHMLAASVDIKSGAIIKGAKGLGGGALDLLHAPLTAWVNQLDGFAARIVYDASLDFAKKTATDLSPKQQQDSADLMMFSIMGGIREFDPRLGRRHPLVGLANPFLKYPLGEFGITGIYGSGGYGGQMRMRSGKSKSRLGSALSGIASMSVILVLVTYLINSLFGRKDNPFDPVRRIPIAGSLFDRYFTGGLFAFSLIKDFQKAMGKKPEDVPDALLKFAIDDTIKYGLGLQMYRNAIDLIQATSQGGIVQDSQGRNATNVFDAQGVMQIQEIASFLTKGKTSYITASQDKTPPADLLSLITKFNPLTLMASSAIGELTPEKAQAASGGLPTAGEIASYIANKGITTQERDKFISTLTKAQSDSIVAQDVTGIANPNKDINFTSSTSSSATGGGKKLSLSKPKVDSVVPVKPKKLKLKKGKKIKVPKIKVGKKLKLKSIKIPKPKLNKIPKIKYTPNNTFKVGKAL